MQENLENVFEQRGNNKDCYQGSTLNSPLMEIENFDPNKKDWILCLIGPFLWSGKSRSR